MIALVKLIHLDENENRSSGYVLAPIAGTVFSKRFIGEKNLLENYPEIDTSKPVLVSSTITGQDPEWGDNVQITIVQNVETSDVLEVAKELGEAEVIQVDHGVAAEVEAEEEGKGK